MFVGCLRAQSCKYRTGSPLCRPVRPTRSAAVVAVLLALALTGCQTEGGDTALPTAELGPTVPASPPTPEAPAPSPTAAAPDPAAEEVLAAYRGYWDAFLEANDPPDETSLALQTYATGEAYEAVFDATQTNRLGGRAVRLPEGSVSRREVEVVSLEGDGASVRDCAVDDAVVVDLDSGEVLDDDVVTRLATGELVREAGGWKVSFTRVEQTWEGVAGCAVE